MSLSSESIHLSQLFRLDDEARNALLARCQSVTRVRGQMLFEQGAKHSRSFIIEDGLVRTYYTSSAGREITMAFWSAGDIVGGPSFFGGARHTWSGVCTRNSRLWSISGHDLNDLAIKNSQIAVWLAGVLIFKLRWMSILVQSHGTESAQLRLARMLVMLAEAYGDRERDGLVIKHQMNQSDIAALVGASRQWTNRMLGSLQDDGILDLSGRQLKITDIDRLRRSVGD